VYIARELRLAGNASSSGKRKQIFQLSSLWGEKDKNIPNTKRILISKGE
jgi:hypothetical protein